MSGYREKLVAELIALIEDNAIAWRKAAFYSDPRVEEIYSRLVREWEERGGEGIPLDYASIEELEALVAVAREYAFMSEARARALAMRRMGGGGDNEDTGRSFLSRLLKRS